MTIKVLLIEDDTIDQMAFMRKHKRDNWPYEVTIAATLEEAHEALKNHNFDIILIDYLIGQDTAFDLIEHVGATPYVIMTGHGSEKIAVRAIQSGAYDYLIKTADGGYLTMLPTTIEKVLAQKQANDELIRYREHLEELVEERTKDLKTTNQQLNQEIQAHKETIKALQASESRFSTVINAMNDLVFTLDTEGRTTHIFGRRSNIKSEEFIGKTASDLLGKEAALLHEVSNKKALQGEVVTYEWTHPIPDGSTQYYQTVLSPLFDSQSEVIGIIGVRRNVTKSKLADQQKIELTLEHQRSQLLRNFITQATHEFRTPLSVISTSAYLLERTESKDSRKRHVHKIEDQVNAITTLVDNLTTLSQIDNQDDIILQEINLNDIIEMNLDKVKTIVQQKSLNIQYRPQPISRILGDHDLLYKAIRMILNNALNFSPNNNNVTINTLQNDANAIIFISDNGQGIQEKDLPHIFERFFRGDVHGTTRGFGLGLPIAKEIIEKHNGTIEIQSAVNQGTTVIIYLPLIE